MRIWERLFVACLWLGCILVQDVTSFRVELASTGSLLQKLRRDTKSSERFPSERGVSKRGKCTGFPCMFSHLADHAGSASMRKLNKQLLFECVSDPNCFVSGKKRSYESNPPPAMSGDYDDEMMAYESGREDPLSYHNNLDIQDYFENPNVDSWSHVAENPAWDGSADHDWSRVHSPQIKPVSERRNVYSRRHVRRTGSYP